MRDLKNNVAVVSLLDPVTLTSTAIADTKTNYVDLQGYDSAVIAVAYGTVATPAENSELIAILQESDTTTDTDFDTVATTDLIGAFTAVDGAADDNAVQKVGYIGCKRYIRVLLDITNTGSGLTSVPVAVAAVLGNADTCPVTAPTPAAAS